MNGMRPGGHRGPGPGPRPGRQGGPRGGFGGRHGEPPPPRGFRRRGGCLGPGCLMSVLPVLGIIGLFIAAIGLIL